MWQSILGIVDKVLAYFTPKQNVIRLKQELRDREDEKFRLLHEQCTPAKIRRIVWLTRRIDDINERLRDHATD